MKCPICEAELANGYCLDCYADVLAKLGELRSITYTIENCVKTGSDADTLSDMIVQTEDLIAYAEDLKGQFEDAPVVSKNG